MRLVTSLVDSLILDGRKVHLSLGMILSTDTFKIDTLVTGHCSITFKIWNVSAWMCIAYGAVVKVVNFFVDVPIEASTINSAALVLNLS